MTLLFFSFLICPKSEESGEITQGAAFNQGLDTILLAKTKRFLAKEIQLLFGIYNIWPFHGHSQVYSIKLEEIAHKRIKGKGTVFDDKRILLILFNIDKEWRQWFLVLSLLHQLLCRSW